MWRYVCKKSFWPTKIGSPVISILSGYKWGELALSIRKIFISNVERLRRSKYELLNNTKRRWSSAWITGGLKNIQRPILLPRVLNVTSAFSNFTWSSVYPAKEKISSLFGSRSASSNILSDDLFSWVPPFHPTKSPINFVGCKNSIKNPHGNAIWNPYRDPGLESLGILLRIGILTVSDSLRKT